MTFVNFDQTRIAPNDERGTREILQHVATVARETAEKHLPEYVLDDSESLSIETVRRPCGVGVELYAVRNEDEERQLFRVHVDFRTGFEIHAYDILRTVKESIFKHF